MPSIFNTTPDYRRLLTVLSGGKPDRVPVYEFFSDVAVQMAALRNWLPAETLPQGGDAGLDRLICAQYGLGYDYVPVSVPFGFPAYNITSITDVSGFSRSFLDDHHPLVASWDDLESLPWPGPSDADFGPLEYVTRHLPDGMMAVANLGGGLLEWAMWMMGAEQFSLAMYDDPDLVSDLIARINAQQVAVADLAAQVDGVMAVAIGDDMGFKTQTFLPPKKLRELIFPGLKRIADAIHAHGKPFILHSCGNLAAVMDDLIDTVGVDAKHSYEDAIMPVREVVACWGGRVAVLGGVDMDRLCRADEGDLRAYVRGILEACAPGGGYALGSGNSIANYVPPVNLFAMLDEALRN